MRRGVEPGIAEAIVAMVETVIEQLGVERRPLSDPPVGLVVSGTAADEMLDRAAILLGDEHLGLTLAQRLPIGSLGEIDYGWCTSSTLREGIQMLARFYGIATQRVRLEFTEDAKTAQLTFHRPAESRHSRHWSEFASAIVATRIRQTLGQLDLAFPRVAFTHDSPRDRTRHDAFFGTRVSFGASLERVDFPASLLDRPQLTASKPLVELLARRMRELAPIMATTDPVLDRVRRTLVAMLDDGVTDLDVLAVRLGENKRTLQRWLRERSTSHSRLLDELRSTRAAVLLDSGIRVVEVATRLGFAEPSAFFRAYRRWTGTSPRGRYDDDDDDG